MELIKISPDRERAKSILKMVPLLEEDVKTKNVEKMAPLIALNYYEIVKELITAILLINGYKTLSHKDLFEYVEKNYTEFSEEEISFLDDLRVLRNRIAYEGFFVNSDYIKSNESLFKKIIRKLKEIIKEIIK